MFKINDNFCIIPETYLFSEVARKIEKFKKENPDTPIIRMGIGDVTLPICEVAIKAMHKAVEDMASSDTFYGYGPEQGYAFLREAISKHDYGSRGIKIGIDEIFVSDGAKSDVGNIGDLFSIHNTIAVTDPVYPVYIDTNVMAGRGGNLNNDGKWSKIEYISCNSDNEMIPSLPTKTPDIIYLCYPNNPTGTALSHNQLKIWVDYARKNKILILFDSAYEAYITTENVPHSIYEIEGAKECAIEFRSYSKTAGFTGLRCGYTVVPKELYGENSNGERVEVNRLWNRRQSTKFNGASYITQRAAESLYSEEGRAQVQQSIDYYMRNAQILRDGCASAGLNIFGGIDAPYIWIKNPNGMSSWEFFELLLYKCNIAGTPGVGFGPSGEGYFRLTAFGKYEDTIEAVKRLHQLL